MHGVRANHLFDILNLSLAQETRDYGRATREQFIAARKTTRMAAGWRNAESVLGASHSV
jgi:hypothetical protein